MWETWVWSLSWEDPPEKGKATHSRPGEFHRLYSLWGLKESDTTEWLSIGLPGDQKLEKKTTVLKINFKKSLEETGTDRLLEWEQSGDINDPFT